MTVESPVTYYAREIEKAGNENIAETIRNADESQLTDENFISALKSSNPEIKSHLEALKEDLEEESGPKSFPMQEHAGAELTEKAQAYADFLVEERNIRPVVIDSKTLFYKYDQETRRWEEVDFELIKKQANKEMGKDYTNHFLRQFKQSFKDHHKYTEFKEMGLDRKKILLKDGNILDLETKETRPANKEDLALNSINAVYNPDAEPDRIKEFIEKTIDTEEGVKVIQEFLGYCLTWPSDKFEKALLILGYTDTGKSTLLKTIEQLFEGSNTTSMSFPQLGMDRAFHIDKLRDSLVNFDMDMDDKEIRRKSRVKKAISKEPLHADPKGEKGYEFQPKTNFMIASNNAPDDSSATDAYYNRFKTVMATTRIDPEDKERNLVEKLTTEKNMSWLLNWAIEGLERLEEQNRFSKEMTEYEIKKAWDKFGTSTQRFISDQIRVKTEDAKNIRTSDVYEAYELWCEKKLETPVPRNQFVSQAASHPDMRKEKAMVENGGRAMCFMNIEVKDYAI
ncbi:DNA primase family protein [Candidatus Nanohalovita haloferacivicina]|uniref:DNA primase family protein n=1 Tax=Candidatus Nanohalovita haloferacivicina TaxID=2978046 RepID=UPI00325FD049|nr:Phage or plasmid associated DNA primase/helicase [Candidatus Nanohalobia archaeon BNXNv]